MTRACGAECDQCGFEVEQPDDEWWLMPNGLFVKKLFLPKAGTYVPQHAHKFDHITWLRRGSIRMWNDKKYWPRRRAPADIHIAAGVKHTFQTLQDDTEMYCIHHLKTEHYPVVVAENVFEGVA
jgi:hypothetical protein